jgi:hypothetical protein
MHRQPRTALLVAGTVPALLLMGCSTAVTGTPAPAGATASATPGAAPADAVTWIDGVCGSLQPMLKALSSAPKGDSSDPQATVKGLRGYFGNAVTSLDTALDGLKAAAPSPVDGGDQFVTSLTGTLTKLRSSFQDAKTRIDAVDPSDVTQLATALPAALAPLQDLQNLPDPTADLKNTPELDQAAQLAPNCKALPGAGG